MHSVTEAGISEARDVGISDGGIAAPPAGGPVTAPPSEEAAPPAAPDADLWTRCLAIIAEELNPVTFKSWFETSRPVGFDGSVFVVAAANSFARNWLEERFAGLVASTLTRVSGRPCTARFVVTDGAAGRDPELTVPDAAAEPSAVQAGSVERVRESAPEPPAAKFTFENFVAGESNNFAYHAALRTAEEPGSEYNPLFIYGGSGLGKTHLLQAIGHYVRVHRPHLKVKSVTTEQMVNDFLDAIRGGSRDLIVGFRKRYRMNDVLLVDDIQFLMGKQQTQDEFFHTFNELYDAHKQIVIACDRPPQDLETLEGRLKSRFNQGLIIDIQPPSLETRIAILRRKVADRRRPVPEDVLELIAERVTTNVRELEGALINLFAYSQLVPGVLNLDTAREWLKTAYPERTVRPIPVSLIQQEVCKYYQVPLPELTGSKRSQGIVYPRQVAMYLARELTDLSLPRIGAEFGGRDHTTVIHACRKIGVLMSERRETYNQVQALTAVIRQRM